MQVKKSWKHVIIIFVQKYMNYKKMLKINSYIIIKFESFM